MPRAKEPDAVEKMVDEAELQQGTAEWYQARVGKVTSSCFGKLAGKGRSGGGFTQTAFTYMDQLIAERITGRPAEEIKSKFIDHGNEHEPTARQLYQWNAQGDHTLKQVGFVNHPTIAMCGGSPDCLIQPDGVLEIKCPYNVHRHLANIENDGPSDRDYTWQSQGHMWITERDWCDFVSFHPNVPKAFQFHVSRIYRDEDVIEELEEKIPRFLEQLSIRLEKITSSIRLDTWSTESNGQEDSSSKD